MSREAPKVFWERPALQRMVLLVALLGPGLVAANAGNDAGGIATYSTVGAKYGYGLLWTIIPMTIGLVVVQTMAARMGAVTGKGLAELIREQYGVRWSVVAAVAVLIANLGLCISEFVGIGAACELVSIPHQIAIPVAVIAIWWLLIRGSYTVAERVFVLMTLPFFAYPIAAILAHPHWGAVGHALVVPNIHHTRSYVLLVVATTGTTLTPYMQLYLQSAVVDRGVGVSKLRQTSMDAGFGAIFACVVATFVIIATGATLFVHGHHSINGAADAARALRPLAGQYAELLFGIGLLGASLLAAAILPVTTAYVVAEIFGFEKGLAHRPREAPVFAATITIMLLIGAVVALVPGLPIIPLLVTVQIINGILLPVILFFAYRLTLDKELMGEHRAGPIGRVLAGITVFVCSLLSMGAIVAALG